MEQEKDLVYDLTDVRRGRPGTERFCLRIRRLCIRKGDAIALVGPSGCGKSTALDMLAGTLMPEAGRRYIVHAGGRQTDVLDAWGRGGANALAGFRRRHLGYVLQTGGLLPFLTARENITLTCRVLGTLGRRREAIAAITDRLGITPLLDKLPATLSVGERQRVAIAKALAHAPEIILADEPTAALDPAHSKDVMRLFLELARSQDATVVMVSHDQELAAQTGFELVFITVSSDADGVTAVLDHPGKEGNTWAPSRR